MRIKWERRRRKMEKVEDGRKMKERKFYEYGKENDIEGAKKAIEEGIDIHSTNKHKQTALHLSLYHKHFQFAYFLINNTNIDIEATDNFGNSPVMRLLTFPDINDKNFAKSVLTEEIFKFAIYLIETKKVDIKKMNRRGHSLLFCCIFNGQYKLAKYLIEKNDVSSRKYPFASELNFAIKCKADEDFLIYLEEKRGYSSIVLYKNAIIFKRYSFAVYLYEKYFHITNELLNYDISLLQQKRIYFSRQSFSTNNNEKRIVKLNEISMAHLHFVHVLAREAKGENLNNDLEYNLVDCFNILRKIGNFDKFIQLLRISKLDSIKNQMNVLKKSIEMNFFHYAKRIIEVYSIPIFENIQEANYIFAISVEKGCEWFVRYLVDEKKVNPNYSGKYLPLTQYLSQCAKKRNLFDENYFKYLLQIGLKINHPFLKVIYHNLSIVKALLTNPSGFDINHSSVKQVILDIGFQNENFEVTKYLLKNYVKDINLSNLNIGTYISSIPYRSQFYNNPISSYKEVKNICTAIDAGCSLVGIGNTSLNAMDCIRTKSKYYSSCIGTQLFIVEKKIIMKGLELWHSPHTHITLPFTKENICDWKLLFTSTLNHSPLVFQSNK